MDTLAVAFIEHPIVVVTYALLLVAIVGFGWWVAGFSFGVRNLITMSEESEHVEHRQTWVMQGLYILMVVLGIWEIIRIFFYNAPTSYWWLVIVLLTPLWIPWLYRLFTGKKSDGH